jgi:hypothetical protein
MVGGLCALGAIRKQGSGSVELLQSTGPMHRSGYLPHHWAKAHWVFPGSPGILPVVFS